MSIRQRLCGHVAAENRESQAVFTCVVCGHCAHADTNTAINIRDRALAPVGGATLAALPEQGASGRTGRDRTHQPADGNTDSRVNQLPDDTAASAA